MGFNRPPGKKKGVRTFTTGSGPGSLHGVGRRLVSRPMNSSQISQLNASVLREIAQAPAAPSIQLPPLNNEDKWDDFYPDENPDHDDFLDVLDGTSQLNISGAGGEFEHLREDATTTPAQRYVLSHTSNLTMGANLYQIVQS